MTCILREYQYTILISSRSVIIGMRNVSGGSCIENWECRVERERVERERVERERVERERVERERGR